LGLGNTILSDDGVGIYVARELKKSIPTFDVDFKEASLGGLELLDLINGYEQVILIDAVQTGKHPVGTLISLKAEDLKGGSAMTRHQVPFPEALALGHALHMDLPSEIKIYAIEVKDVMTFRESCTHDVQKHIPEIVQKIAEDCFGLNGQWSKVISNQKGNKK
jgi:hydrogenase maturation protease